MGISLGILLACASVSFGQTNVLSQNAVGYVKVSVDEGDLAMVSYDFLDIDGNPTTISDVAGTQLPLNSRAFLWNAAGQSFVIENFQAGLKAAADAWAPDTNPIAPGDGLFLEAATGGASSSYDVFMTGEVPGDNNNSGTTDVAVADGLSLAGYPYPASVLWTSTTLAAGATVGDRVIGWDAGAQGYTIDNYQPGLKAAPDAWSNPGDVIEPGEGFFYENITGGGYSWIELKPYAFP
jgi:hypothetical protein